MPIWQMTYFVKLLLSVPKQWSLSSVPFHFRTFRVGHHQLHSMDWFMTPKIAYVRSQRRWSCHSLYTGMTGKTSHQTCYNRITKESELSVMPSATSRRPCILLREHSIDIMYVWLSNCYLILSGRSSRDSTQVKPWRQYKMNWNSAPIRAQLNPSSRVSSRALRSSLE
jgi:hypothetical protein